MKNIKILVATHKSYRMPIEDIYLPIHVGKEGKKEIGFIGDNTGDNISKKNSSFCELTSLYWAWKNTECDYIGLSHYRRYFTNKSTMKINNKDKYDIIINRKNIEDIFAEGFEIILPKKRNYYIETVWSHYKNAHHIEDLNLTRKIIENNYMEYLDSFDKVMKGRTLHLYNMFIMRKKDFDAYCTWLFDILFKLEEQIDIDNYDSYQYRVFGFISERLFNVWINHHNMNKKLLPVINTEDIDWIKKGFNFIKRKIG